MITRRGLIRGLIATPAIVAVGNIMPINWRLVSTVAVVPGGWGWRVVHRGTTLGLSHWFDDHANAVAAATEIDARFNLDKIALQVMSGRVPLEARDALYAIQRKHAGCMDDYVTAGPTVSDQTREIIKEWAAARLSQQQRLPQSAA